jgi:hypothetical protein
MPFPVQRRFRIKTGQAGRLAGKDRGELEIEIVHGAIDHRLALPHALFVKQESLFEQRGTTHNHVRRCDQWINIECRYVLVDGDNLDVGIQFAQPACRTFHARITNRRMSHQDLAVQIAGLDGAGVGKHEPTHARCREFIGN